MTGRALTRRIVAPLLATVGLAGLAWAGAWRVPAWWWQDGGSPPVAPVVDPERRTVTIPATLHPDALEEADPPSHHLVTWAGGRAGHKAFLRTAVPDVAILDALEALGGRPGDTLREESWTRRDDPDDPAADLRAEGSRLEVGVVLPGADGADGAVHDISALLEDVDDKGYEWRLAGNRALIAVWRSGCVVCLQSCPGGRVGNARATMRDHLHARSRFRASPLARSLGEGARVKVVLALTE